MGRAAGVSRRRKKTRNLKYPKRNTLQAAKRKLIGKNNKIECNAVSKNWDPSRSVAQNLTSMGLVADANKTLGIPKSAEEMGLPVEMEEQVAYHVDAAKAENVIGQLEKEANKPPPKNFKFGTESAKFIVYMIEKHGEDYAAMSRDPRNYYQDSAGQIRKKIKKFKSIPINWNSYLKAKEMADNHETDSIEVSTV